MTDFEKIPMVKLNDCEKASLEQVMRAGNKVLKAYHEQIKEKLGRTYSRLVFKNEILSGKQCIHGVRIKKSDKELIGKVAAIEWQVLTAYSGVFIREARRYTHDFGNMVKFEDNYHEAVIAALHAVYSYTTDESRFKTYLITVIRHRLGRCMNSVRFLSHWKHSAIKLWQEYKKIRDDYPADVSLYTIAKFMRLNASEVRLLEQLNSQVFNLSDTDDNSHVNKSSKHFSLLQVPDHRKNEMVDHDQVEAVERAKQKMSKWELAVLHAFLAEGEQRGWQSRIAAKHGKSRAAPNFTLKIVKQKILDAYGRGKISVQAA